MTDTLDPGKTWEVLQVGKQRFYWLAYRPAIEFSLLCEHGEAAVDEPQNAKQWLIAEGFASYESDALERALAALEKAPGEYYRHYNRATLIHYIYYRRRARKSKASHRIDRRTVVAPEHLWSRSAPERSKPVTESGDGWYKYPIIKVSPKLVWIISDRGSLLSLQREELKSKGCIQRIGQAAYYTEQGRTVWDRDPRFKQNEEENNWSWEYLFFRNFRTNSFFSRATKQSPGNAGRFPLLGLKPPFTHDDVLRAFRPKALELHPDQGGDAERFRELVAERECALRMANERREKQ